jgi:hypothetical protein
MCPYGLSNSVNWTLRRYNCPKAGLACSMRASTAWCPVESVSGLRNSHHATRRVRGYRFKTNASTYIVVPKLLTTAPPGHWSYRLVQRGWPSLHPTACRCGVRLSISWDIM